MPLEEFNHLLADFAAPQWPGFTPPLAFEKPESSWTICTLIGPEKSHLGQVMTPVAIAECGISSASSRSLAQDRRPQRNPPSVLLGHNDKQLALAIPDHGPQSIASIDPEKLASFVESTGTVVLKPVQNHQSKGVVMVHAQSNHRSTLPILA
jgi:hypothetical protein